MIANVDKLVEMGDMSEKAMQTLRAGKYSIKFSIEDLFGP
jgi:hypothetical protein